MIDYSDRTSSGSASSKLKAKDKPKLVQQNNLFDKKSRVKKKVQHAFVLCL